MLLTGNEPWEYYFEPQGRINNKQWLSKNQARSVIAKSQEVLRRFYMPFSFNSSGPVVQIPCKDGKTITASSTKILYLSKTSIKINAPVKV